MLAVCHGIMIVIILVTSVTQFYRFIVIDYFLGSWENVAHVARKAGHGSSISHFLNSPLTKRSVNLEAHNALLLITAHSLASLGIEIEATLGVKATH